MAPHAPGARGGAAGPTLDFTAIGDHGIIGNMRTVALVDLKASIDYLCYPTFDSPTVFASLLDPERGGAFTIEPALSEARIKQIYVPETNVLLTRFSSEEGVAEITDLMPIASDEHDDQNRLVRLVTVIRGVIDFTVRCAPRFDYGQASHEATAHPFENDPGAHSVWFDPDSDIAAMRLSASQPLEVEDGAAVSTFRLDAKDDCTACFVLDAPVRESEKEPAAPAAIRNSEPCVRSTIAYWRTWSERSTYRGRYREMVNRSALVLKLLTHREEGAIVAAATFGMPETVKGERRWDYRYVWIRDAAFSVYALLRLGHVEEASAFVAWMSRRTRAAEFDGGLKVVYTVSGECPMDERELPSLADGHRAQPPLIGNAAADQFQLDMYGALMDAVYLANKYGHATSHDGWANITKMVDFVVDHWESRDAGIWEFRDQERELLHSRLMCWVTVDRAVRLAIKRSLPFPHQRWFKARGEIYNDIFENFWNEELQSFVQSKGSDVLDAAILMMPLVKFIAPTDPRWLSTLDAIGRYLVDDPIVYRYPPDASDGLSGQEGSFSACSFWYAEALVRAGRVDEGRLLFEKMLGLANHLGLFSEEVSAAGDQLGNFPQCLSHLALISAAFELDRTLDRGRGPWHG